MTPEQKLAAAQEAVALHPTHSTVRSDPEPRRRGVISAIEVANYVAGNWNEAGHNLSGADVLAIVREFHAQCMKAGDGRACLASGSYAVRG